jgi:transcriptional regulator with XRE-family HTH domain
MKKTPTAHNRKKTPVRIAFGKIVREKRIAMALSQEKLAEKADLHTNYVGSVERGERNIAIENIFALANALECTAKDLIPEGTFKLN